VDEDAPSFSIATHNVEADSMKASFLTELTRAGHRRGYMKAGLDPTGALECVDALLARRCDIICLQELQRCKFGPDACNFCARGTCKQNHAEMVDRRLKVLKPLCLPV
jgi:hypothetical protein